MTPRPLSLALIVVLGGAASALGPMAAAADRAPSATASQAVDPIRFAPPPLEVIPAEPASLLRPLIERYRADHAALEHVRGLVDGARDPLHATRRAAQREAFLDAWQTRLRNVPAEALGQDDRLDRLLLERHLRIEARSQQAARERFEAVRGLLPGYAPLVALLEDRRDLRQADPRAAADTLEQARRDLEARASRLTASGGAPTTPPVLALRAAVHAEALRAALKDWHAHQSGYDPDFSWWVDAPHAALDAQLAAHITLLRETLGGAKDPEALHADPIGDAAIAEALRDEGIPYSPVELMAAAERELAWCRAEMAKAAREMGVADWREALERVKQRHVAPGEQPALVVQLADEAVAFLEARELVTVPDGTRRGWRMTMLSPEWQLQAPFFLGGRDVWVAFPADGMPHERKLNALRGNNRHFSRAVVQHELVPGHHLQHWYAQRFATHRAPFDSPFWTEGWALYWELRLYDMGFAASPEDRIGMLFWRSHRAARILFSLGVQSGRMTPEEAVRLLIDRVGHEPENARAEVRRSIAGDYGPLYQVAYLVGGWQFRALHEERVIRGGWSEREFHDRVLREGSMPVHLLRERLFDRVGTGAPAADWRFLDNPANASAR
jgi:uncharacterized protein (DUF885 family)